MHVYSAGRRGKNDGLSGETSSAPQTVSSEQWGGWPKVSYSAEAIVVETPVKGWSEGLNHSKVNGTCRCLRLNLTVTEYQWRNSRKRLYEEVGFLAQSQDNERWLPTWVEPPSVEQHAGWCERATCQPLLDWMSIARNLSYIISLAISVGISGLRSILWCRSVDLIM